jgi:hypothetical protein
MEANNIKSLFESIEAQRNKVLNLENILANEINKINTDFDIKINLLQNEKKNKIENAKSQPIPIKNSVKLQLENIDKKIKDNESELLKINNPNFINEKIKELEAWKISQMQSLMENFQKVTAKYKSDTNNPEFSRLSREYYLNDRAIEAEYESKKADINNNSSISSLIKQKINDLKIKKNEIENNAKKQTEKNTIISEIEATYIANISKEENNKSIAITNKKNEINSNINNINNDINAILDNINNIINSESIVNHKLPLLTFNKIQENLELLGTDNFSDPFSFLFYKNEDGKKPPIILDFFNKSHIIIKYNKSNEKEAISFIKLLVLKSLLSLKPGQLHTYLQSNKSEYGSINYLDESIKIPINNIKNTIDNLIKDRSTKINEDDDIYNWVDYNKTQKLFLNFVLINYLDLNEELSDYNKKEILKSLCDNTLIKIGVNLLLGYNTSKNNSDNDFLKIVQSSQNIKIIDFDNLSNNISEEFKITSEIINTFNEMIKKHNKISLNFLDFEEYQLENIQKKWENNKYNAGKDIKLPIGYDQNNELFYFEINVKGGAIHSSIGGKTGTGKSEFISSVIISLVLTYPPESLELYILDFKDGKFSYRFEKNIQHVKSILHVKNIEYIISIFDYLLIEFKRRNDLFKNLSDKSNVPIDDIDDYTSYLKNNEDSEFELLRRIIVVVDETQEIFSDVNYSPISFNTSFNVVKDKINSFLQVCRFTGINFIFSYNSEINNIEFTLPIGNIYNKYSASNHRIKLGNKEIQYLYSKNNMSIIVPKLIDNSIKEYSAEIYVEENLLKFSDYYDSSSNNLLGVTNTYIKEKVSINLNNNSNESIYFKYEDSKKLINLIKCLLISSTNSTINTIFKILTENKNNSLYKSIVDLCGNDYDTDISIENLSNIIDAKKNTNPNDRMYILVLNNTNLREFINRNLSLINDSSLSNTYFIFADSVGTNFYNIDFTHQIFLNPKDIIEHKIPYKILPNHALYSNNTKNQNKLFKLFDEIDMKINTKFLVNLQYNIEVIESNKTESMQYNKPDITSLIERIKNQNIKLGK